VIAQRRSAGLPGRLPEVMVAMDFPSRLPVKIDRLKAKNLQGAIFDLIRKLIAISGASHYYRGTAGLVGFD